MSIASEIQKRVNLPPQNVFAINLFVSCRNLENFLKAHFKKEGLSLQQYNILRILNTANPTPLSTLEIRERMIEKMSDTSRIVDRLILKKLVTKKINSTDNRLVEIRITSKGLSVLKKLNNTDQKLTEYLSVLSDEEAVLMSSLLEKIIAKS